MTTHQVRVTIEDFGPRPWKIVLVDDIDSDDYDEVNLTVGSLVWDSWKMLWPQVAAILEREEMHDDTRVLVTFDNTYVADKPRSVTADLFTAAWVAQHDEPMGVPGMTLFIDNKDGKVVMSANNKPGGRVLPKFAFDREESIGVAARLLECALRLPAEGES